MSDNAVAGATSVDHEDEVLAELTAPVPEVGDGGPEMVQLLTPEGQRVENTEYDEYVKDLTDEDLRGFYRDLVLIRDPNGPSRARVRLDFVADSLGDQVIAKPARLRFIRKIANRPHLNVEPEREFASSMSVKLPGPGHS